MRVIAALTALSALCGPIPDKHPAPTPAQRACLVAPPPPERSWSVVIDGCPAPLVCITDDDAREIAAEVEDRRAWDRGAWVLCGTE